MKPFTTFLVLAFVFAFPFGASAEEATSTKPMRPLEERREARHEEIKDRASTTPFRAAIGEIRKEIKGKGEGETLEAAKERAQTEIARREAILKAQIARIEGAKKLSDSDQATLIANLEARLAELATLKSDIANSLGTTTLRADIQQLKDLHKEFRAELPKAALTGAAERVLSVVSQMEQFSVKLSARIDALESAGTDVTELRANLTSYNASVAAAKTKGQTALDAAKTTDISTAATVRATIVAAQKDLKAARETAREIVEALGGKKGSDTTAE